MKHDKILPHIWNNYCFWPEALKDCFFFIYINILFRCVQKFTFIKILFRDSKIFDRMGTPEYEKLMNIVDPWNYFSRLTMPVNFH
jgi:hypothetical protein